MSLATGLTPAYPERAPWGTAGALRAWQEEALAAYFDREPRDFLAAATPGAGKTTFALRLAATLLQRRTVDRITVVAPTEHLKRQWADAAHKVGIRLNPGYKNGQAFGGSRFHGMAITLPPRRNWTGHRSVGGEPHRRRSRSGRRWCRIPHQAQDSVGHRCARRARRRSWQPPP